MLGHVVFFIYFSQGLIVKNVLYLQQNGQQDVSFPFLALPPSPVPGRYSPNSCWWNKPVNEWLTQEDRREGGLWAMGSLGQRGFWVTGSGLVLSCSEVEEGDNESQERINPLGNTLLQGRNRVPRIKAYGLQREWEAREVDRAGRPLEQCADTMSGNPRQEGAQEGED